LRNVQTNRYLKADFAGKHQFLAGPANELEVGETLGTPASLLHLLSFALTHSLPQAPWNPERTGLMGNMFTRRDGETCTQGKKNQRPTGYQLLGNNDLFILTR
jgi:hypothetical protein